MAELKRNTDFATDTARARVDAQRMRAIAQQDLQPAAGECRRDDANSGGLGFDPYNHVGSQALKPGAA